MRGPFLDGLQALLRREIARRRIEPLTDATSGQTVPLNCHAADLDVLVVKPDDVPPGGLSQQDRLFPLLDPERPGITACCDYMLFCQQEADRGGDLYVLLAELKQGGRGAAVQLRNGCLLARWLLSMAALHQPVAPTPRRVFFRGLVFTAQRDRPRPRTGRGKVSYPDPDTLLAELRVLHLPDRSVTGFALEPLLNDCGDPPWALRL